MDAEYRDLTENNIAYEGLRKADDYGKYSLLGKSPVAIGDGPKWIAGNPTTSMLSVYSTSPVGILGAIVDTTDVKGILRLDCNATDFYSQRNYPAYAQQVTYVSSRKSFDLYDIVAKEYVARNMHSGQRISIPAKSARVIYELPAKTRLKIKNGKILANHQIISYN